VIKRGWDWLGLSPTDPDKVGGLIEAPQLAQCLTTNKADFIRANGGSGLHLAYRKAIQHELARQFSLWGVARERSSQERRRVARPLERDLENVLSGLEDAFPILATLIERQVGGQRLLRVGVGTKPSPQSLPVPTEVLWEQKPAEAAQSRELPSQRERHQEGRERPTTPLEAAPRGPRRPRRYRLRIDFEQRASDRELSRLVGSTIWINETHPAYRRATSSRSTGYHLALATALAVANVAIEPEGLADFIALFLARWGAA
jgi:hypothetical protein